MLRICPTDMLRISPTSLPVSGSTLETAGASGRSRFSPKKTIAGTSTRYASTPPPTMMPAIRGPMMYPTPSSCGVISAARMPPLSPTALPAASLPYRATLPTSLNRWVARWMNW